MSALTLQNSGMAQANRKYTLYGDGLGLQVPDEELSPRPDFLDVCCLNRLEGFFVEGVCGGKG